MSQETYIHTCLSKIRYKIKPFACMDLFKNPEPVMKMKHTYMLKFLRISCFWTLLSMYVCFKSICLWWKTLNQGSQKLSSTVFRLIMYVCLKKVQNPSACHAFCNSNSTQITEPQRFFLIILCGARALSYFNATGMKLVCMSLSNRQNLLVSEDVKFLIESIQHLTFNYFVWIVRRRSTSKSPARL